MEVIYRVLLFIVLFLGWAMIPFGLPGTLIMLAGAVLYSIPMDYTHGSNTQIILTLTVLAIFAEITENAVTYFAARRARVPSMTTLFAIVGGIIGAIIGVPVPVVGSVLGMFLGIFLTTFIISYAQTVDLKKAWHHAKAALISRTLGTGVKMIIGAIMGIYTMLKI